MEHSQSLRDWLAATAIEVSASVELRRRAPSQSYAVYATRTIQARETVALIPKRAILSHRTTNLDHDTLGQLPPDTPHAFRLALCVLHEILIGAQSRWATYLAHCPRERVPIAIVWDDHARGIVKGTELDRELGRIAITEATLATFYNQFAPLILLSDSYASPPTLDQFLYAYSLVSSRAFQVDAFHTLSMVPLADLFDHSSPNQVHLESDHFVCAECGSLDECEHDDEQHLRPGKVGAGVNDVQHTRSAKAALGADDGETCEMVADEDVEPGQEVFNTYGALSNAKLLAYYGFALEANELDGCSFDLAEVTARVEDEVELVQAREGAERDEEVREALELLEGLLIQEQGMSEEPRLRRLWIDAEANVSWELWATVVLAGSPLTVEAGATADERVDQLKQATVALSRPWQTLTDEDDDESHSDDKSARDTSDRSLKPAEREVLLVHLDALRSLIIARIASQHLPNLSGSDLLTLAEEQSSTTSTADQLALDFLANERLLLECVLAKWDQLASHLSLSSTANRQIDEQDRDLITKT